MSAYRLVWLCVVMKEVPEINKYLRELEEDGSVSAINQKTPRLNSELYARKKSFVTQTGQ
jgi:hypothetical protein